MNPETEPRESPERIRSLSWLVVLLGMALPWTVAVTLKLLFQLLGRPTVPWSMFYAFYSIEYELILTLLFSVPFFLFVVIGRAATRRPPHGKISRSARIVLLGTLSVGTLGTIINFVLIFWEFDEDVFFPAIAFLIMLFQCFCFLVGLACGYVASLMYSTMCWKGPNEVQSPGAYRMSPHPPTESRRLEKQGPGAWDQSPGKDSTHNS
jgi:hypothetical protein